MQSNSQDLEVSNYENPRDDMMWKGDASWDRKAYEDDTGLGRDNYQRITGAIPVRSKPGFLSIRRALISAVVTIFALVMITQVYHSFSADPVFIQSTEAKGDGYQRGFFLRIYTQMCKWIRPCSSTDHQGFATAGKHGAETEKAQILGGANSFWRSGKSDPESWSKEEEKLREIPDYVIDYAPYVHLFSGEQFWPCDIAEHLIHTTPHLNYTPIVAESDHPTLSDLDKFNEWGRFVYLQSDDNVEERPEWLGGKANIPGDPDSTDNGSGAAGGRSDAPTVLIVVDKGDGVVDAFWFYFYSYNLGLKVFNVRFGNHVGDWEHMMVRFHHGKPKAVYFSEHNFGAAYTYNAVEKIGKRPVGYSATGSHAMYAQPGVHAFVLPWGLLHDVADRGPLWDPALNMYSYTYDYKNDTLRSSTLTPEAPTEWFYFISRWGDKHYPLSDPRQYEVAGQYHYVSGPLGPRYKYLGRKRACIVRGCTIRDSLTGLSAPREWEGPGDGEATEDEGLYQIVQEE